MVNLTTDDDNYDNATVTNGNGGGGGGSSSYAPFDYNPFTFTIGVIGILGNGFVLTIIALKPNLRKTNAHFFILNQSLMDFMAAIFLILVRVTKKDYLHMYSVADDVFCRLVVSGYVSWAMLVSSTYNLVAVSVERLLAVVYPIWHRNNFTRRKLWITLVVVWLVGPVVEMGSIITSGLQGTRCRTNYFWPSYDHQNAFGVASVLIQFFIPITIHTYCYGRIVWVFAIKKKSLPTASSTTDQPEVSKQNQARIRNILKTFALLTLCFFLCWVINECLWFGLNLNLIPYSFADNPLYYFSVIAVFANCCVNPFIYMFKYQEFQASVREILRCGKVQPIGGSSMANTSEAGRRAAAMQSRQTVSTVAQATSTMNQNNTG